MVTPSNPGMFELAFYWLIPKFRTKPKVYQNLKNKRQSQPRTARPLICNFDFNLIKVIINGWYRGFWDHIAIAKCAFGTEFPYHSTKVTCMRVTFERETESW